MFRFCSTSTWILWGELVLHCDASSVSVGAALLRPAPDRKLQPAAYKSWVQNNRDQNNSHIERESSAIVFNVTKCRQNPLGRHFIRLTDHKPLITLLGAHKPVPQLAAERIKRWAMLLAAYEYTTEFISGNHNMYADFPSKKPIKTWCPTEEQVSVNVMFIEGDQFVNTLVVALETKRYPVLSKSVVINLEGLAR